MVTGILEVTVASDEHRENQDMGTEAGLETRQGVLWMTGAETRCTMHECSFHKEYTDGKATVNSGSGGTQE